MSRIVSAIALTALVLVASVTEGRLLAHTVRIEAYVGTAPKSARLEAEWTVRAGEQDLVLHVKRLRLISGGGSPSDVIQALKPYRASAFKIVGDEATIAKLTAAPAGAEVEMQGVLRLGPARTLLISTVDVDD